MRKALVGTLKTTANTMMAMLFIVSTIMVGCTYEDTTHHPAASADLLGAYNTDVDYGKATISAEATAKDVDGNPLAVNCNIDYTGAPVVYVERLGTPISMIGEPRYNADGTIDYQFADGNTFHRTERIEKKGVDLTITPGWGGGYISEVLNDSTELVYAVFTDAAHAFANIPGKVNTWDTTIRTEVPYLRVVKQEAKPEPEPTTLRMRAELVEVVDETAYYNVFAEDVTSSGEVVKSYPFLGVPAATWGQWRPNVTAQTVTSVSFIVNDTVSDITKENPITGLGEGGYFWVENHSAQMYVFEAGFSALPDAEGSTTRLVRGSINLWLYQVGFRHPETGEVYYFKFTGEAKTTVNEVDANNVYRRTVEIICLDQVVDTQVGTVQLTLVQ